MLRMQTHVGSEAKFLNAVDDVLNEVMSHWVIDLVMLHYQLPAPITISSSSYLSLQIHYHFSWLASGSCTWNNLPDAIRDHLCHS